MTPTPHTPGPWSRANLELALCNSDEAGQGIVDEVLRMLNSHAVLLEALKRCRKDLVEHSNEFDGDRSNKNRWSVDGYLKSLAKVDAAIAQAEGRTP